MSDWHVTRTRMRDGVWEGIVSGAGDASARPDIHVSHLDQPVPGVELSHDADAGRWSLRIPIPTGAIADGVQTFVVFDGADNDKLADFTLVAGEAMADDLRAEVELLRAELDMLKRAFRRHCVETM